MVLGEVDGVQVVDALEGIMIILLNTLRGARHLKLHVPSAIIGLKFIMALLPVRVPLVLESFALQLNVGLVLKRSRSVQSVPVHPPLRPALPFAMAETVVVSLGWLFQMDRWLLLAISRQLVWSRWQPEALRLQRLLG